MIRLVLPLIVLFFFVFDGTVMQVILPEISYDIIPRFVMVLIIFIGLYIKRSTALFYGMVFGLATDLIYTDYIGAYMFAMAFTAYIVASFAPLFHINILTSLLLSIFGVVILEFQIYGLYTVIGIAQVPMHDFLLGRLGLTLVLNGVFAMIIYYPLKRHFEALEEVRRDRRREVTRS